MVRQVSSSGSSTPAPAAVSPSPKLIALSDKVEAAVENTFQNYARPSKSTKKISATVKT